MKTRKDRERAVRGALREAVAHYAEDADTQPWNRKKMRKAQIKAAEALADFAFLLNTEGTEPEQETLL